MQNLNTTMVVKNNKVVLGMSGGVDSTASALLLKRRGYDVSGLYFDVFGNSESESWKKAQKAAEKVGINIKYIDVSKEFKTKIVASFYNEYISGMTPNPCVLCNKAIKFKVLFDEADAVGAYYVATGHYASVVEKEGKYYISQCSSNKDQSYVLWKLNCEEASRIKFPLSEFKSKQDVRDMLEKEGFACFADSDSQEICFIEDNDYVRFLKEKMGYKPPSGKFIDIEGKELGEHKGIINFTIGQRKGLGVTFGKPVFVTEIKARENKVVLGSNEDLFKNAVVATNCRIENLTNKTLGGKIRYAAPLAECRIECVGEGKILTIFDKPQRAPTPGQSIVWYDGDLVIGGGIISESYNI